MSAREVKIPPPQRFSRRWFSERGRTAGWVAVVTILIWVFADIQVTEPRHIRATLRIRAGAGSNTVLLSPPEISVEFDVNGRRHALDQFEKDLEASEWILEYDAAKQLGPGTHRERTREILRNARTTSLAKVGDAGLEITSAKPKYVDIDLDSLRLIENVKVEFRYSGAVLADPPAKIEPERIDLRVPVRLSEDLNAENLILATATLDLRDVPPGKATTREVAVLPPGIPGAQLARKKVLVTFKVLQQTDSKTFTVTVEPKLPRAWLADDTLSKYELKWPAGETWTRSINVSGNRIDLEKLRAEDIKAYIELKESDLKPVESWLPGEVKIDFPPGQKVRLAGEPVPPVSYKFVERTPTPPTP